MIRGFMGREIRDPIGVIVTKFTETVGNLTRIFIIGENVTGTFVIPPRYRKQVMRVQYL
ncbi:MAG: hypothetical protein QOK88_03520 [Nitrososphaeraceae archaeon]|nr:hypothetical protein [Nitrososphaeraceae archaeon]MDW0134560.1 hypothetical protein [Nitrososphaeraceae archaeon]